MLDKSLHLPYSVNGKGKHHMNNIVKGMTFSESLRSYANWCDEHPALQQSAHISTYGETAQQAKEIMRADSTAKLDLLPVNNIVYLMQTFGQVTIQHVLNKDAVCDLSVVDNKVVAVLKPEFAELRHQV